jgi:UDP-N-acetylmuramate--alanine ligase
MDFDLMVPGDFNKSNAAHAAAAAAEMGGESKVVKKALEHFTGTARRLELRGEKKGVKIYDDYAHHPTEIKASLKAMREKCGDKKIICVYQPHQYSRTYAFLDELKNSFGDADKVLIPNIYPARDTAEDIKKISAEKLVSLINDAGGNKAIWTKDFTTTIKTLDSIANPSDTIIVMGAGDIYKVADMILE